MQWTLSFLLLCLSLHFELFQGKEFATGKAGNDKQWTFYEGVAWCETNHFRLVVLEADQDIEEFKVFVSGLSDMNSTRYWIGLMRKKPSTTFTWIDGRQFSTRPDLGWKIGQPNGTDDCVYLENMGNSSKPTLKLVGQDCSEPVRNVICEKRGKLYLVLILVTSSVLIITLFGLMLTFKKMKKIKEVSRINLKKEIERKATLRSLRSENQNMLAMAMASSMHQAMAPQWMAPSQHQSLGFARSQLPRTEELGLDKSKQDGLSANNMNIYDNYNFYENFEEEPDEKPTRPAGSPSVPNRPMLMGNKSGIMPSTLPSGRPSMPMMGAPNMPTPGIDGVPVLGARSMSSRFPTSRPSAPGVAVPSPTPPNEDRSHSKRRKKK